MSIKIVVKITKKHDFKISAIQFPINCFSSQRMNPNRNSHPESLKYCCLIVISPKVIRQK
jgi:hypothetical protein